MKRIIYLVSMVSLLGFGTMMATQWHVPSQYSTITAAIAVASTNDTIVIAAGTYAESVSVNKASLTLIGSGSGTVISPPSGNGITVSKDNIVIKSLRVTHSLSNGISASGVSNFTLTDVSCDSNKVHGLSIGSNSSNITVSGGSYSANGTSRGQGNGAGINMDASGQKTISNVSIIGPLTASNNTSMGIWAYAEAIYDTIRALTIGSTGTITLSNNGGAGVVLYGNVNGATITGDFTKGSANAAGVLCVSTSFSTPYAPINTMIKKCIFNPGYWSFQPAISLSDFGEATLFITYTSPYNISADSNQFNVPTSGIDSLIWDASDDSTLGRVQRTNDNILPVELTNFTATVRGRQIQLRWDTATEINNYGFEIERTPSLALPLKGGGLGGGQWSSIAFIPGKGTTNVPQVYMYNDAVPLSGNFQYRLKQIDRDGKFEYSPAIEANVQLSPDDFGLTQNFPNPFNPSTTIRFALQNKQFAEVEIFNSVGEEVCTLFKGVAEAGVVNELQFDGKQFASGTYFYSLTSDGRRDIKKMLLLK